MKLFSLILMVGLCHGSVALAAKVSSQTLPAGNASPPEAAEPIERIPLQLLYFTASWCGPCQMMKTQTWPDPTVKRALEHYEFTTIDVDAQPKLTTQWSVRAMPSYIVTDPSGTIELTRISGFMDAPRMATWLNDVYNTAYDTLEEQRANQAAFAANWAQLDPLFEGTLSESQFKASLTALYTLLAIRDDLEPEAAQKLEILLVSLAKAYPKRLIDGMLHEDLQVRVKVARVLQADDFQLDPWASRAAREAAVKAYKAL